jgi:hypothetical protein
MELAEAIEAVPPVFLPRRSRWVVGVDLGQSADPTAIAVLERQDGVLDFNSEIDRHCGCGVIPQQKSMRLLVRHLERLKLHTSYPDQVQHVKEMLARPPLCGDGDRVQPAELVIDQTGVGKAVGDIFDAAGMAPVKIVITAGNESTCAGFNTWHVAKTILISQVDALLHTGELKFADKLAEATAMKGELLDFRRSLSATGRATYQARSGQHDDLVLSVAIATFGSHAPTGNGKFWNVDMVDRNRKELRNEQ